MGQVPFVDVAALTFSRLAERVDSVRRIVSTTGGMDRVTLTRTYQSERCLGEPVLSKYWMSNAQSLSSSPIDVNEPVLAIAFQPIIGVTVNAAIMLDVTYHCQFFNLETPNLS